MREPVKARQRRWIGLALLILAVSTQRWESGLSAVSSAGTAGVRLDEPEPWSSAEPGLVNGVAPGGPAARAGLRKGDRVLEINGIPAVSYHELHRLADNLQAGDSLKYTVLQGTETRIIPLRLEGRVGRMWVSLLGNALAAGIFIGMGVLVYWKRPGDRRAFTFFLMCLPFALIFSEANLAEVTRGDFIGPRTLASIVRIGAWLCLLIPPLLYLPLIFPKPSPLVEKYPGILGWICALPVVIAVLIAARAPVADSASGEPYLFAAADALSELARRRRLVSVALSIGLLAPAAFLFWRWVRSARRKGWRSVLLSEPGLSIPIFFLTPVLFSLALFQLPAAFVSLQVIGRLRFTLLFSVFGLELLAAPVVLFIIAVVAWDSMFRRYHGAGSVEKGQLRWPLRGTVTAVAGFILSFVTLILLESFGPVFIGGGWIAVVPTLFLLLIPVSFAFAIDRYRVVE